MNYCKQARLFALLMMMALFAVGVLRAEASFVDVSDDVGIKLSNLPSSWGDVNNDGWIDLYNDGKVWINNSGKEFTSLAVSGSGVIVDIDNDGLGDLVNYSPAVSVLRNIGNERFEAMALPTLPKTVLPTLPKTVSQGVACGDFDGDGFVDFYFGGYEYRKNDIPYYYSDLFLINKGGSGFLLDSGISYYPARGVTACDFDEDSDLDIYVSNYRLNPNVLWINDGQAYFKRAKVKHNVDAGDGHSIGAAWGDFDNDGRIDLFAANLAHRGDPWKDQPESRFLRNLGLKKKFVFDDLGTCGMLYQESYASPAVGDFDNDGDLDLYLTTIYAKETSGMKRENFPVLYRNDGNWKFVDVTSNAGLDGLLPTYQAAWGDYDRDGDLDLVTAGRLFRNDNQPANWIEIRLVGDGERISTSAVGSQVRIKIGDVVLTRQVEIGTGRGNGNSPVLHFGLGDHSEPVTLQISWANGDKMVVADAAPNQIHTIANGFVEANP